jgi:hypothetical protein
VLAPEAAVALTVVGALTNALPAAAQGVPPLATSSNVQMLAHVPGSAAAMNFKGKYAYGSGWAGITVLDISVCEWLVARPDWGERGLFRPGLQTRAALGARPDRVGSRRHEHTPDERATACAPGRARRASARDGPCGFR